MGALDIIKKAVILSIPNIDTSRASIENKIIDAVAAYADAEAVERDNTLKVIQNALASQKNTTIEYYRRKAVEFQYGDQLSYDPVNMGAYYETVNVDKRIIVQAGIVPYSDIYTLLVNKLGSDGHLAPLSAAELAGFKTYFRAFQPLGLELNINSLAVAKITDPNVTVYVKAGSDADVVAQNINDAFKAQEAVLRRTNTILLSELEDTMQSVEGVVGVGWNAPKATETTVTGIVRDVMPEAGIFYLENGAFTFATEITTNNIQALQ